MIYLSVSEFAKLRGCTQQHVQKICKDGKIQAELMSNNKGRPKYQIPISELTPDQQLEYYKIHSLTIPDELIPKKKKPAKKAKSYEEFSESERKEINQWNSVIADWDRYCAAAGCNRGEATKFFIAYAKDKYPGVKLSPGTLYRKKKAIEDKDLDGLVDGRGKARKGYSSVPNEIVCLFNNLILNEHMKVSNAYETMQLKFEEDNERELMAKLPSVDTCYRMYHKIPKVLIALSTGDKYYSDKFEPTIDRDYSDIEVNEVWVADGHTIDVISIADDGAKSLHRLTLSAFMDLRSGVFVGWVITDNPSSQATLCALRKAILNTRTTPRYIYCDNGLEYLTHDIGGKGHRTRKKVKVEIKMPETILDRLGISMLNALPANGKAKHIERDFKDFTFLSSLFDTYCGSSVTTRPERLKENLKAGKAPKDSELSRTIDTMIEGYFNHRIYNGAVAADRGKKKIDVYNEHLLKLRMPKDENVLNLMLMRTSRMQTIGKNGVSIVVRGERLYYKNDNLHWLQGKRVYVRYNPDDLMSVRVYSEKDKLIDVVPLNTAMMQSFLSQVDNQEELSRAMSTKRKYRKIVKERLNVISEASKERHGDINVLKLYERKAERNMAETTFKHTAPITEIMYAEDQDRLPEAVGESTKVRVDIKRMIRNAEKRKDDY